MTLKTAAAAALLLLLAIGTASADAVDPEQVPTSCEGPEYNSRRGARDACEAAMRFQTPYLPTMGAMLFANIEVTAEKCGFGLLPGFYKGRSAALRWVNSLVVYKRLAAALEDAYEASSTPERRAACASGYREWGPRARRGSDGALGAMYR